MLTYTHTHTHTHTHRNYRCCGQGLAGGGEPGSTHVEVHDLPNPAPHSLCKDCVKDKKGLIGPKMAKLGI